MVQGETAPPGEPARAEGEPKHGIRAFVLEGDAAVQTTDADVIAAAYADRKPLWALLEARTPDAERLLADVFKIHPLAIDDVWNDIGIPKVEDFGDYIEVVMHGVCEDDVAGRDVPLTLTELDVIIGGRFVLTRAHGVLASAIGPVAAELTRSPRLLKKGPAWVAHAILDRMVDAYVPIVDRFEEQIEQIETKVLGGRAPKAQHATMRQILLVKRSLQMLRRTTVSQREILHRLARAEFDEIPREAMPFYRDIYDHFARVTELVDSYRELTTGLLEAHFSIQSNQMNEIMKRLTVISTIMLPLSVIAGIYGMNFKEMPELEWAYGYPFAIGLMVVVAVGIILYFKKRRWL